MFRYEIRVIRGESAAMSQFHSKLYTIIWEHNIISKGACTTYKTLKIGKVREFSNV